MRPEDTVFTYGLDIPIDFINPGGAGNNEFIINPEDIGYNVGSVLPDGVYTIRYLVEKKGFLQPLVKYILLAHNTKCKVYNCLANVKKENCCEDDKVNGALASYAMYKSMLYNAAMGRVEKVKEQLQCLNKNSGCGCGCS